MKTLRTKIIITISTFLIGVSVAVWLIKLKPDSTVYSVKFCDLMKESKLYDGKIVEIQTSYKQGYEASFLTDSDCKDSITATCFLDNESCGTIFTWLESAQSSQVKIAVIGRYHDSKYDSFDGYVHKIEILEVKDTNVSNSSK